MFSLLNLNRSGHSKSSPTTSTDKSPINTARLSVDLTNHQQESGTRFLPSPRLTMHNDDSALIIDARNSINEICDAELDLSDLTSCGEKNYLNIDNPNAAAAPIIKVRS